MALLTPNEARALLGLPPLDELPPVRCEVRRRWWQFWR